MKPYLTYIWLLAFSLLVQELRAQSACCPFIDSVKVFPQNPTKSDTIRIGLYIATPNPSKRVSITHNVLPGNIYIQGCYALLSGSATMNYFSDTITIGKLPDTTYQIHITAYWNIDTNTCTGVFDSSKITDTLIVHAPESISGFISNNNLVIHPNPVHNEFSISVPQNISITQVQIRDMQGCTLQQYNNTNTSLNISSLPVGVYLLYIDTDKGRYVSKILKE